MVGLLSKRLSRRRRLRDSGNDSDCHNGVCIWVPGWDWVELNCLLGSQVEYGSRIGDARVFS
jgi:hypothetical protein